MDYPKFFDEITSITVCDPLAGFLGSTTGGIIEYGYIDAVKLTGHSCPTVASAYWMTHLAMRALYGCELPCRGGLRVEFSEARAHGVTGVMASVVQLLTGAAAEEGFKGISGIFYRNDLMTFGVAGERHIRFVHRDNLNHVDVSVDLSKIPVSREMSKLMHRCLSGEATMSENVMFAQLWQDRVRRLVLEHGEDADVFNVIRRR